MIRRFLINLLILMSTFTWPTSHALAAGDKIRLDPEDVTRWADDIFKPSFKEHRFSGAAIVVVQDGKMIVSRSYGYADLAARKPVDLEKTQFQIASVTKTFTATALAQLMDRGLVDSLDDPANKYLMRVQLPKGYGRNITLRDLLTHRSGFDETSFEMFLRDRVVPVPVSGDEISRHIPPIVREPGTLSVYSNFGLSVVGWVIEDVSGLSLDEYFRRHIFEPLGMNHSLLYLNNANGQELARPYGYYRNGEIKPGVPAGGHPMYAGAGDIQASVTDMAKYMIVHLSRGQGDGPHLMSTPLYDLMHARLAGNHPAVKGNGMAFSIGNWNGWKTVGHGGHLPGFMSELLLLPDSGIGLFVVVMIGDADITLGEKIRGWFGDNRMTPLPGHVIERPLTQLDVVHMFQTRYLGAYRPEQGTADEPLDQYAGRYLSELRSRTGIEKAFGLLAPRAGITTVDVRKDGSLMVNGAGPYRQRDRDVFWMENAGPDISRPVQSVFQSPMYAFLRDGAGRVSHIHSLHSASASARISGPAAPFYSSLMYGAFWVCLSGFAVALWPSASRLERVGCISVLLVTVLMLVAAGLLTLGFGPHDPLEFQILLGRMWRFEALQAIAIAVVLVGLASSWLVFKAWRRGYWGGGAGGVLRRIHYTALAAAMILLILPFWYGNLLPVPQWP